MAAVRGVGARVALGSASEDEALELEIRLFAELQGGERVEDDAGPTRASFPAERPQSRAELEHYVREGFRHPGLEASHRKGFWGGLVRALQHRGVETDEETLLALPFETVELDPEVEALFPT